MLLAKLIVILFKQSLHDLWGNYRVYSKWGFVQPQGSVIRNIENVTIGKEFSISPHCQLFAQGKIGDAKIVIGDNVSLNYNVMINADCGGRIRIGNDVRIGPYTVLRAANHKISNKYRKS